MLQAAVIGIVTVLAAIPFRRQNPEYGMALAIAAMLILTFLSLGKLEELVSGIEQLESYLDVDESYLKTLVKIVGITYVAEFSCAICQDAGYRSVGEQIAVFAKLAILSVSMPIILALMETISGLLG